MIKRVQTLCLFTFIFATSSMAAEEDCAIDLVMKDQLTKTNELSKNVIEATVRERDIEKEACIPALALLNSQLNISTANLSSLFGGLGTKIRDMACAAANNAVKGTAKILNATWEAPYGLATVGGGATTDGSSGVNLQESTDTSNYINSQVLGLAGDSIGGVSDGLSSEISNLSGIKNSKLDSKSSSSTFNGGGNALDNF